MPAASYFCFCVAAAAAPVLSFSFVYSDSFLLVAAACCCCCLLLLFIAAAVYCCCLLLLLAAAALYLFCLLLLLLQAPGICLLTTVSCCSRRQRQRASLWRPRVCIKRRRLNYNKLNKARDKHSVSFCLLFSPLGVSFCVSFIIFLMFKVSPCMQLWGPLSIASHLCCSGPQLRLH